MKTLQEVIDILGPEICDLYKIDQLKEVEVEQRRQLILTSPQWIGINLNKIEKIEERAVVFAIYGRNFSLSIWKGVKMTHFSIY